MNISQETKDTLLGTFYTTVIATVVTVLINHYERKTGKSIITLIPGLGSSSSDDSQK